MFVLSCACTCWDLEPSGAGSEGREGVLCCDKRGESSSGQRRIRNPQYLEEEVQLTPPPETRRTRRKNKNGTRRFGRFLSGFRDAGTRQSPPCHRRLQHRRHLSSPHQCPPHRHTNLLPAIWVFARGDIGPDHGDVGEHRRHRGVGLQAGGGHPAQHQPPQVCPSGRLHPRRSHPRQCWQNHPGVASWFVEGGTRKWQRQGSYGGILEDHSHLQPSHAQGCC